MCHPYTNKHTTSQMPSKRLLSLFIYECNSDKHIPALMCLGIGGLCGLSMSFSQKTSCISVFLPNLSSSLYTYFLCFSFYSVVLYSIIVSPSLSQPLSTSARSLSQVSTFLHLHFVPCVFVCLLPFCCAQSF